MKRPFPFLLLFIVINTTIRAQPLVGTWEMISIKGINAAGERFASDASSNREIKIITPTHYMLIAQDVEGDSLVFNRCYAGAIRVDGNKYDEIPMLSSSPIFDNVKTDYTWKIVNDKFVQAGTLIRPDGKKVILEELVFGRVKASASYINNPTNGTWKLLSSTYVTADGTRHSDSNETVNALFIITPTHWMYASSRDKKFEHVMGGGYTMKDDKYYPALDFASFPKKLWGQTEMTQKIDGEKLYVTGTSIFPDGRKFIWNDVFEKVN
jgi:hypothetical protein